MFLVLVSLNFADDFKIFKYLELKELLSNVTSKVEPVDPVFTNKIYNLETKRHIRQASS